VLTDNDAVVTCRDCPLTINRPWVQVVCLCAWRHIRGCELVHEQKVYYDVYMQGCTVDCRAIAKSYISKCLDIACTRRADD
jgi:hypothetical protein